jgi:hypothetical protein
MAPIPPTPASFAFRREAQAKRALDVSAWP